MADKKEIKEEDYLIVIYNRNEVGASMYRNYPYEEALNIADNELAKLVIQLSKKYDELRLLKQLIKDLKITQEKMYNGI